MKILVFSDSHHFLSGMVQAIEEERPDHVIHLGDMIGDAEELSRRFPTLPICMVPGNCDGWSTVPHIKRITLQGKHILLSHGHLWLVKSNYRLAIAAAQKSGVDILLFGHTHRAYCQQLENGLWVMNPGASRSSYGAILLEKDTVSCTLTQLI